MDNQPEPTVVAGNGITIEPNNGVEFAPVVLVVDVRRLRTIACAAPGCHTVGCYAIDSGLTADDDRDKALRALEARGWVTRGPDALCPPHKDRW